MEFVNQKVEKPFKVDGIEYVLRKASGAAATAYNQAKLRGVEIRSEDASEDGPRTMRNLAGLAASESLVVSLCAFRKGEEKHIDVSLVESWDHEIQKTLFEWVKELSPSLFEGADDLEALERARTRLDQRIERLRERLKNRQSLTAG